MHLFLSLKENINKQEKFEIKKVRQIIELKQIKKEKKKNGFRALLFDLRGRESNGSYFMFSTVLL